MKRTRYRRHARALFVEGLEERRLLASVALSGGILKITGNNTAEMVNIEQVSPGWVTVSGDGISGVKELSDTIKRSGLAPANVANFLGVGLAIAGKPGNIDGKPAVEVPITLAKGKVGVGGIALVAVPRLFQPE